MKRILATALAAILLFGALSVVSAAKDLEYCRLCGGSGEYHCQNCGNNGVVTCDGCGGAGGSVCPGEAGKGPCDKGYYLCPSCKGDSLTRSGDGQIPPDAKPGSCGTCAGSGKPGYVRCINCHTTPGWCECATCNGTGKVECQSCIPAKAIGYKCPKCTGTGYVLVANPMPPESDNDGVKNVPVYGDHIIIDEEWHHIVYGGDGSGDNLPNNSGGGNDQPVNDQPVNSQPANDQPVNASTEEEATETEPVETEPEETYKLPNDRNNGYDVVDAVVRIEPSEMTDEQQKYYASLSDKELASILKKIEEIVATSKPGKAGGNLTEETLRKLAKKNGFESMQDGRIFPIYFEGKADIGFPVKITVRIEKGLLDGGSDIYVYRIDEEGKISPVGKADYVTYEDGSIEVLTFSTDSFSSFFTARKELDTDLSDMEAAPTVGAEADDGSSPVMFIIIAVLVALSAGAAFIVPKYIKKKQ